MLEPITFWSLIIGGLFWWFAASLVNGDVMQVIAAVFGGGFFALALFCMGALAWRAL